MMLDEIIPKALTYLTKIGWSQFNLREFSRQEDIDFYQLTRIIPTKEAFLSATMVWIDAQANAQNAPSADANLSEADQLFEGIMARLDLLLPHRKALQDVKQTLLTAPSDGLWIAERWIQHLYNYSRRHNSQSHLFSFAWVVLYMRTFWVWIDDDESLSRTMKTLDQSIQHFLKLKSYCS